MAHVHFFLSTVSAEFRSYRDALRHDLDRPNVTVKVQEDFIATGTQTLDKLDNYIQQCDGVIHLVGDMTGALAQTPSVALIAKRYPDFAERFPMLAPFLKADGPLLPYTQWEAWLALYHGKVLIIAEPEHGAPRDERYQLDEAERATQQAHLTRLASVERYPEVRFADADRLAVDILRSKLLDILVQAGAATKPINLPYLSLGGLFKGREAELDAVTRRLGRIPDSASPIFPVALHGLGGVGKTRLALEYALSRTGDYSALLFVVADSPEALQRNLGALCAPAILNLPSQGEGEEGQQRDAVVEWLRRYPGWLLILDNIDTEVAAEAVETFLPQLFGGHVLLTGRFADWSGSVVSVAVDVLSAEAGVAFLLERTDGKRRKNPDDPAAARSVAEELGCLALALQQAGAHIAAQRLDFGRYLARWQSERDKVLAWFDPRLMQYPKSVAITWQTSFEQLSAHARQMLQRFAWLSPEPIPESLMDVSVPGITATAGNPFDSLAELETYSLVTRASDTHSFGVHRLIQEVTRRGQTNNGALIEAVAWIDNAFTTGDPSNVASWPTLDPLLPHGQAVSIYADQTGILLPTARLMGHVGMMLLAKARYQEALPFLRRTLELDEAFFGTDSLCVAVDLNNLAQLLHKTGRVAEAELHTRRALAISERKLGRTHQSLVPVLNNLATLLCEKNPDDTTEAQTHMERALAIAGQRYPDVEALMNNLGALLQTAGDFPEAEKLFRDALAIAERRRGKNHPVVAHCLNNLADLLRLSSRSSDAEPLMRRALAIQESNFAPDHPNIATVLNNLAGLLQHTTEGLAESARDGRLAVAEQLVERALAIDELKLGPNHVNVGRDLNTLAGVFHIAGRFPQAELLFKRALSIVVPALGVNHWSCRHVQERFANLLRAMGKTDSEIDEELRNACASPGRRR